MTDKKNNPVSVQDGVKGEGFEDYIRNARDGFTSFINAFEWRTDLRTHCENLLIAYDQMRERLSTPAVGEDVEKEIGNYIHEVNEKNTTIIGTIKVAAASPVSDAGEWQLCPKCNGDGNLARYNSPNLSSGIDLECDVCNGKKIIVKPINK